MKRLISIGSILAALVGIVIISFTLSGRNRPQATTASPAFAGFPVDQARFIDISASPEAMQQMSGPEYADQIRDWLLTTIISDAGLSPKELNQSLFDLPTVRYGYLRPVGTPDFGDTRARSIGNGRLVVLLPKSDAAAHADALARAADEARKNTGDKPSGVIAFEYEVAPDNLSARVTRRPEIDGSSLFTEQNGYFETTVRMLDDLRTFMSRIDDLTYARLESSELRLGGRKVRGHNHHNITLDDAAALWSAQTKLRTKNDEFDKFVAQKKQEFDGRWVGRRYEGESERLRLEAGRDADLAQVQGEVDSERERLGVVQHTGFSLDPSFVYARVKTELQGRAGMAMVLASGGKFSASDLAEAAEQAGNGKMDSFYTLLQKLDADRARPIIQYLKRECSYQAARYDGALQGTEVGMIEV